MGILLNITDRFIEDDLLNTWLPLNTGLTGIKSLSFMIVYPVVESELLLTHLGVNNVSCVALPSLISKWCGYREKEQRSE